jgi:hypothetical protein
MKKLLFVLIIAFPSLVSGSDDVNIVLKLSKNIDLVIDGGNIEIRDRSIIFLNDQYDAIPKLIDRLPSGQPVWAYSVGIFNAGKEINPDPDNFSEENILTVTKVEKISLVEKDDKTSLKAKAWYPDGKWELWEISTDPLKEIFVWQRVPSGGNQPLCFKVHVPRRSPCLQYYQTGKGKYILNDAVRFVKDGVIDTLVSKNESELIYYAVNQYNSFRIILSDSGNIRINKGIDAHKPNPGIPSWDLDKNGNQTEPEWKIIWNTGGIKAFPAAGELLLLPAILRAGSILIL